jgi:hypothetical protein
VEEFDRDLRRHFFHRALHLIGSVCKPVGVDVYSDPATPTAHGPLSFRLPIVCSSSILKALSRLALGPCRAASPAALAILGVARGRVKPARLRATAKAEWRDHRWRYHVAPTEDRRSPQCDPLSIENGQSHRRHCTPVRLSRAGWSRQFGRASAPMIPSALRMARW